MSLSPEQSFAKKVCDTLGLTTVGTIVGVDPLLVLWWAIAGVACVVHVVFLRIMRPSWVTFFRGDRSFLERVPVLSAARAKWVEFAAFVERHRTTSLAWWRALAFFYLLWYLSAHSVWALVRRLVSDPDVSRAIGMGVVFPLAVAGVLWLYTNPKWPFMAWAIGTAPEGWIEPPGSAESIVWVAVLGAGIACGLVELGRAFHPPIVRALLGRIPVPLYHVGVLVAAAFACVMAYLDVDGNATESSDPDASYRKARTEHLAFLAIALVAVATTFVVMPAFDRTTFMSPALRPLRMP